MPPYPQFYDATDTTLLTAAIALSIEAGDQNGPTTYHLWNGKGNSPAAASLLKNAALYVLCFDGAKEVYSGFPVQDEKWIRAAVTGKNSAADPTMEDQTTGLVPIGAGSPLIFKDISPDCARFFQVEIDVPAGANASDQDIFLKLVFDEASIILPFRLATLAGGGVIPDRMDVGARRLMRGRGITASGTDAVVVQMGSFVYDGEQFNDLTRSATLNQNAADGALAAGQSYIAVLSQRRDKTVTTTKGNKASSPTTPATPSGEIYLGKITVVYQAGGTSIIGQADVDTTGVTYGEYLVRSAGGLNVKVGAGQALTTSETQAFSGSSSTIGVTNNATNYLWLRRDGTFSVTTTPTPPAVGIELLAKIVTASGAITSITDRRAFVDNALYDHVIQLRRDGDIGATASDFAWAPAPFDYLIHRVRLELGRQGTATGGAVKVDVLRRSVGKDMSGAGTTIYTSSGSDDQRPKIAYDATALQAESLDFEIVYGLRGDRISASIVAVPSGISVNPKDLLVEVILRRRPRNEDDTT